MGSLLSKHKHKSPAAPQIIEQTIENTNKSVIADIIEKTNIIREEKNIDDPDMLAAIIKNTNWNERAPYAVTCFHLEQVPALEQPSYLVSPSCLVSPSAPPLCDNKNLYC